ncbi:MAG: monovalent cation:H+ antiporter, CPA1 (nhx1) [Chrysothrix sp. TS-e1954]|nr:MAG: monovalent cation:H+ antiporter, CPA1 (nhx1) [Chrysothrix sp. TS-e1954]
MATDLVWSLTSILKRDASDADSEEPEAGQKEIFASWSLFIMITLLIIALWISYFLQTRRIQAVHETVISIFAGMFVGLILRLTTDPSVLNFVTFEPEVFFNLLLPPIILASGYELHQGNFFRHIGSILTFAFAGTFISALVLGILLYLWALLPIESTTVTFVDALSVGATLSATDPVTILAIFNAYKVDPDLYTVIFGEAILNDAIAIVLFETAQRYKPKEEDLDGSGTSPSGSLGFLTLLTSIGEFLLVFFGSLIIGLAVGIATSLLLKFTYIRRFPKLESCIILLIAYASYFFANAIHLSGIVSLLFCGICLKHYAYHNMSRRTQLTMKFLFQILAQLSENFIFIYLGLSLFTDSKLLFQPLLILITVVGICVARWMAVFPLSKLINSVLRYRARRQGIESTDELPFSHQAMLYWAGLRGAVGVALAAGLTGANSSALKATVLVVVVLTVIIFGGTTARMLEILNIRTGVVEEIDSDDEFDIEVVGNGTYAKRSGSGFGHNAKTSEEQIRLSAKSRANGTRHNAYSSSNARSSPPDRPGSALARTNSIRTPREGNPATHGLLGSSGDSEDDDDDAADLDLPPSARRPSPHFGGRGEPARTSSAPPASDAHEPTPHSSNAAGTIRSVLQHSREDPATWFRHLDEGFLKPNLLLDPGDGRPGSGNV